MEENLLGIMATKQSLETGAQIFGYWVQNLAEGSAGPKAFMFLQKETSTLLNDNQHFEEEESSTTWSSLPTRIV